MTSSISKATYLIRNWYNFLMRQEEPFKINILKNFVQRFSTNLTYQYQPIYLTSLGASPLILGYLNSVNGLVNTLLAIPTGVMADRSGIKRVLTLTLIFSILSGLLFGFASSWEVGAIALVLSGVAYILDRTVCPMICGSCLATQERLTGMGICDTVSFFPQLVAPLLGATLITIFGGMNVEGIRPLFFIQGIGLIGALAIILWKFNNPISQPIGKNKNVFTDIGAIFKEGYVIKRWLFLTIVAAFPWQVMFYIPLYAAQIKGADQFILGGMSAASTIVFVFFAIPLGHLSDTVGRKKIAGFASILLILSYLVLIWAPNNLVLLLSGLLSGFSMSFTQNLMAISVDLVPREYLGSWYGILGFCRGLIGIVSPLLCGYFWVFVSPSSVFYLLVFMQILALGALLLVPTRFTR